MPKATRTKRCSYHDLYALYTCLHRDITDILLVRQSKKATEADLRRDFEIYGLIEHLTIVKDEKGRSRGYAFIVYDREKDMKGMSSLNSHFCHYSTLLKASGLLY